MLASLRSVSKDGIHSTRAVGRAFGRIMVRMWQLETLTNWAFDVHKES